MTEKYVVGAPRHNGPTLRLKMDGHVVHWKVDGADPSCTADPGLAVALTKAMRTGRPVHIRGPVSEQLLAGVKQAQKVLAGWAPEQLQRVPIKVREQVTQSQSGAGVGMFFSGGVDAFYTLYTRQSELSHLIILRGFDVNLGSDAVWHPIRSMTEAVCSALGLQRIEIKTNSRAAVKGVRWAKLSHGSVLAGAGLTLQGTVKRILVASTREPANPFPCGTHPDLDHLWSTESVVFEHDALVERAKKVASLVSFPLAMRWLRVCHRKPHSYNCAQCEKCLRTMIHLRMAGGLGKCQTLPDQIDLNVVKSLSNHNAATIRRCQQLAEQCQNHGMNDIADALWQSIETHERATPASREDLD